MELAQKWLLLVRRSGWFKDARTQTNTPTFWRGVTVVHCLLVWLGSNCISRYMSLKAAVMCHYSLIPCHDSARHWCRYVGGSDPCRWRQVTWTKISAKEIFKSYAAIKVVWSWTFDRHSFWENLFCTTGCSSHSFQVHPYCRLYSKRTETKDGYSVYRLIVFKIKVWYI